MYAASQEFHNAVSNGNEQKALLIFDDCVFTDEDIDVSTGIQFHEYFNAEEDLSIGQALSNEISFSLFNDDRLLNDYEFGEFLATLGVKIRENSYQQYGIVTMNTKFASYVGNSTYPYITRGGRALASQPSFPVMSLLGYNNRVYAFGSNKQYVVYNDTNGENITSQVKVSKFMRNKTRKWAGRGFYYNKDTRILFIYENGVRSKYEFVPLGWFEADRPNAPDKILIDMTCYDQMQKFDEDMPKASEMGITYPTTIANLYRKLCDKAGVYYKTGSDTFINSSAKIDSEPADFASVTMRDVLKWIAEAACANARFDRDGYLVLDWLKDTSQTYGATDYSEFNPYWYETKKVTKLYNRDTQDSTDKTYGTGDEAYLIQDNPLLKGVS